MKLRRVAGRILEALLPRARPGSAVHARVMEQLSQSLHKIQRPAQAVGPYSDCLVSQVLPAASRRKAVEGNAGNISQLSAGREVG